MLERFARILGLGVAPVAPRLIVWDTTGRHAMRLWGPLSGFATETGRRVSLGEDDEELRSDDWHVLCWSCYEPTGSVSAARLSRRIQTLFMDTDVGGFQTVVCWSLDQERRPDAWITQDEQARLRNNSLMTMASTWPRLVEEKGSEAGALREVDAHTRAFVSDLGSAGLLGRDGEVLRDQLDVLDPHGVQLLLSEPLAPTTDAWHGLAAVLMAARHRFGA